MTRQQLSTEASRTRAEHAFVMREVGLSSWSQICAALDFRSVGAAQLAVQRYRERNPLPSAEAARYGILERKRVTLGIALRSLADAARDGDLPMVARLIEAITRADAELARLYGLSSDKLVIEPLTRDEFGRQAAELLAAVGSEPLRELVGLPVIDAEPEPDTEPWSNIGPGYEFVPQMPAPPPEPPLEHDDPPPARSLTRRQTRYPNHCPRHRHPLPHR